MKNLNYESENELISDIRKIFKPMKLFAALIFISMQCSLASISYSQTIEFEIHMVNSTVSDILSEIENQSEFKIMYSDNFIDVARRVTIDIEKGSIGTVLEQLFAGTNVDYTIKDRFVILTTPELANLEMSRVTQHRSISGTVTDDTGEPLPGVTVVIKGTTQGTVTDANGN